MKRLNYKTLIQNCYRIDSRMECRSKEILKILLIVSGKKQNLPGIFFFIYRNE